MVGVRLELWGPSACLGLERGWAQTSEMSATLCHLCPLPPAIPSSLNPLPPSCPGGSHRQQWPGTQLSRSPPGSAQTH